MSRRTTAIWIAAAVVVAGAGIGVAAVAAAHPRAVTASAGNTARPTTVGATPSATPSAPETSAASSPSTSSAPSAPATTGSGSGTNSGQGAGSGTGTGQTTSKKKVSPDLSYYAFSGQTLTLGGGVSGLVENGGTCTVTVKNASSTVTQAFPASAGPSSTDCGAMAITSPKLTHGSWTLSISYSSPDAAGTSAPSEVTL